MLNIMFNTVHKVYLNPYKGRHVHFSYQSNGDFLKTGNTLEYFINCIQTYNSSLSLVVRFPIDFFLVSQIVKDLSLLS